MDREFEFRVTGQLTWIAHLVEHLIRNQRVVGSNRKWADEEQTAICPVCGIDSVLPLTEEQFNSDFLEQMHHHWFALTEVVKGTMIQ